jgi:hypothetical protein
MPYLRKIVLHCPKGYRMELDSMVGQFLADGVAFANNGGQIPIKSNSTLFLGAESASSRMNTCASSYKKHSNLRACQAAQVTFSASLLAPRRLAAFGLVVQRQESY